MINCVLALLVFYRVHLTSWRLERLHRKYEKCPHISIIVHDFHHNKVGEDSFVNRLSCHSYWSKSKFPIQWNFLWNKTKTALKIVRLQLRWVVIPKIVSFIIYGKYSIIIESRISCQYASKSDKWHYRLIALFKSTITGYAI